MKKLIPLFLITLLLSSASVEAGQDAGKIAQALADRLSDALDFHDDTPTDRFEDENPMWFMFYVRPTQNKNFSRYYAKGFRVGLNGHPYTNIPNISSEDTFHMRHTSPWSFQFSGIGSVHFYKNTNYRNYINSLQSTSDYPKKMTFGSSDNGATCTPRICSHQNPRCPKKECGARQQIASLKFCPGVVFFQNKNWTGNRKLIVKCSPNPRKSYCLSADSLVKTAKSFHFDALIKEVHLFKGKNCTGRSSWYSWRKQKGTVREISSHVQGHIQSVKVVMKAPYNLVF